VLGESLTYSLTAGAVGSSQVDWSWVKYCMVPHTRCVWTEMMLYPDKLSMRLLTNGMLLLQHSHPCFRP
jgi:hypothetical protein